MGIGTSPRVLAGKATQIEGTNTFKMEVTEFENADNPTLKIVYTYYYDDGSLFGTSSLMPWDPNNLEKSILEHEISEEVKTIKAGFCLSSGAFLIGSEGILLER